MMVTSVVVCLFSERELSLYVVVHLSVVCVSSAVFLHLYLLFYHWFWVSFRTIAH